jgi:hypothetical protein
LARTGPPQRLFPVIERLSDAGVPVDRACRVLGIARQNYYKHKRAPTTPPRLRRQWLSGLIREVHVASRGTYGYRRVHAELTLGMGITVCERTVSVLMTQAGIYGLPGPASGETAARRRHHGGLALRGWRDHTEIMSAHTDFVVSAHGRPLTPWVVYDLERVAWVIEGRRHHLTTEERQIIRRSAHQLLAAVAED